MKFFSLIMSFVLSLFGVVPPAQSVDAYTQAEWYALVAEEFDLVYSLEDNDNYDIATDDEYFAVIQACHDNNVIVDEYVADAQITNILVAKSLIVAVGLKLPGLSDEAAVNVAVNAGFVNASVNINGKVEEIVIPKAEANAALKAAGLVYLNNKIPAAQPAYVYTQAEWYALVAKEFDLEYDLNDNDNYDIAADDEYFAVIQACHDNNVIVDEYDADAYVTNVLDAKSLAVAAGLEGVEIPDEVALDVAVDAGFVNVSVNINGKVEEIVIPKAEANAALKTAGLVYLNNNSLT